MMSDWVGRTLGKVQIDSLLARGGIAEVYLGTHITLQRQVAVKILRNQYEDDPDLLERFQREARVVASLRHPNIVQVFDFDTIENHPYLVMEYIQGPSLSRYLKAVHDRVGRLELPTISRLLNAVAGALQYAHESGVVHRDVKPGNILLASRAKQIIPGVTLPGDFQPVLTDFGLVRFLNSSRQTAIGHTAGTPAYMSPEQARGEATDERTDIYSLGIVLYEILTGHVPFEGETTMSVLLKHVHEPPKPIPGLSPLLQSVLNRALAKNKLERFQTAIEFSSAFQAVIEESSDAHTLLNASPVPDIPHPIVSPKPSAPRRKWFPAVATGTVAILLSLFLIFRGFPLPVSPSASETPTTTQILSATVRPALLPLGPTGVLRFKDGAAIMDEVTLAAQAMPAPPKGSQFEIWLNGNGGRQSLGLLTLDENGKGSLAFADGQNRNMLALYDNIEVTIEPKPDSNPDPSGQLAYSFTLPSEALVHIRHLLVSFPLAPKETALIQGLITDANLLDRTTREMLEAQENGDAAIAQVKAESILNVLVGGQSQEHKDWNSDGQITDPGDGYGLLLNGDNLGYIQAVYSHADYAIISPDATQNIILNGTQVKVCTQNLALWAPQLRDLVRAILTSAPGTDLKQPIHDSVELANRILNGIDNDSNGTLETIPGECGTQTAYEHAYYMADMPLLPVIQADAATAITETGTPSPTTAPSVLTAPTRTPKPGQNTSVPPANPGPTKKPPNPNKPPTKTKRNP